MERVQGSGNYIRTQQNIPSVYNLFRLELLRGGGLPTAKILSITQDHPPHGCPLRLGGKPASRIIRLRYLDGILMALEDIWLGRNISKDIKPHHMSESLYEYYKMAMNLIISRMEDKINFKPLPDWTPPEFDMKPGEMAGYIERLAWDQFDELTEFSQTWFNPDICHYVNRR